MSTKKKNTRKHFRDSVFKRDNYSCRGCEYKPLGIIKIEDHLDAHHIVDRNKMPNGGYVPKNGITLCKVGKNAT